MTSKRPGLGLIPIALPPHISISPKVQLLLCLVIGNVSGALISNPPARAWELGAWVTDSINGAYASLNGVTETQSPLPVPPGQPPIGNSASIQPCAAPPSMGPTSSPVAASPNGNLKDPKAKILMGIGVGNRMRSLLNRVSYPDRFDDSADYWTTSDGEIRVTHDANDRVASIRFNR